MTTYVYETVPAAKGAKVRRYEIRQSMKDAALSRHPETGEAIRRVVSGGFGVMKAGSTAPRTAGHGHSCGSCGCH